MQTWNEIVTIVVQRTVYRELCTENCEDMVVGFYRQNPSIGPEPNKFGLF